MTENKDLFSIPLCSLFRSAGCIKFMYAPGSLGSNRIFVNVAPVKDEFKGMKKLNPASNPYNWEKSVVGNFAMTLDEVASTIQFFEWVLQNRHLLDTKQELMAPYFPLKFEHFPKSSGGNVTNSSIMFDMSNNPKTVLKMSTHIKGMTTVVGLSFGDIARIIETFRSVIMDLVDGEDIARKTKSEKKKNLPRTNYTNSSGGTTFKDDDDDNSGGYDDEENFK